MVPPQRPMGLLVLLWKKQNFYSFKNCTRYWFDTGYYCSKWGTEDSQNGRWNQQLRCLHIQRSCSYCAPWNLKFVIVGKVKADSVLFWRLPWNVSVWVMACILWLHHVWAWGRADLCDNIWSEMAEMMRVDLVVLNCLKSRFPFSSNCV